MAVRSEYLDLLAGLKDDRKMGNSDLVRHWRRYYQSWRMLHALLLCLLLIGLQQVTTILAPSLSVILQALTWSFAAFFSSQSFDS